MSETCSSTFFGKRCHYRDDHTGNHRCASTSGGNYYEWDSILSGLGEVDQVEVKGLDVSRKYAALGERLGALVDTKQAAYGDSFGKAGEVLKILYPNGVSHAHMQDLLTVARVLDKLFRVATDRDALGEDPWKDVAGYALLAAARKDSP